MRRLPDPLQRRLCCGPCVMCQETRTLSYNSVEDGCAPKLPTHLLGFKSVDVEKRQERRVTRPAVP